MFTSPIVQSSEIIIKGNHIDKASGNTEIVEPEGLKIKDHEFTYEGGNKRKIDPFIFFKSLYEWFNIKSEGEWSSKSIILYPLLIIDFLFPHEITDIRNPDISVSNLLSKTNG